MHSTITPFTLALSLLSLGVVVQGCESYGVDFQNGGSYFQNISSADPFTFVSIYDNCEADVATNILVDPNGDEVQCSDTPLQPDDVEELSTCPLNKNQMFSGPWAVVIISNNGGGDPIAYERDFNLVVGIPATTTFTPTISVTVTSTPLSTTTSLTTTTTTNTVTSTTVLPAKTRSPTTTVTPKPITTTKIFGPTIKKTAYEFQPIITTKTTTKTCRTSKQPHRDPTLTWLPSILPTKLASVVSELGLLAARDLPPRDAPLGRRVPANREQRIAERKERLAAAANVELAKRAPDAATTTVTDTNPADWITSTSTSLAPTSTIIITSVITQTQVTTTTTTIYSGTTTLPPKTVTLPTKTITKLKPTIFVTTVATITKKPLITITIPKVDPAATKACKLKGGQMV